MSRATPGRMAHDARPRRESLAKRYPKLAWTVAARDGFACVYCGSKGPHQLDHLTPRCRGGADVVSNVVLACLPCNSRRKARSLAAWQRASGLPFTASSVRRHAKRRVA